MTERYAGTNIEVFEVWNWYKRVLRDNEIAGIPPRYWRYGHFSNGQPIPKAARLLYRSREDLMAYFEDPFDVDGNSLHGWLLREAPDVLQPV